MNRHLNRSVVAAFAAWAVFAVPAFAGQQRNPRGGGHQGGNAGGGPRAEGRAVPRGSSQRPQVAAPPRAVAPRAFEPRAVAPRASAPRAVAPRTFEPQAVAPRGGNRSVERGGNRNFEQRGFAQPRVQPRGIRPGVTVRPYYNRPYYNRSYNRPYYGRSYYYSRPFYTFRPRFSVGFGLWVGFPVLYPYYSPYYYSSALPYPYPATPYPGTVAPAATGGLSFDIDPPDASLYVDGQYIGEVGQFTPNDQPLGLTPGRHHVEIRAPGFLVQAFDVDILAGQIIPYQGQLEQQ